ncbi:hypothetical protein [Pedobacter sp. GR22-10]|uniref:hypothetical protein n=1 Tax=Pedobacter sp. GR22-10 TaxID=2994472 RepID=UPI002247886B|nr:hypothetical protein [Pedobacter sp. GR22-10]
MSKKLKKTRLKINLLSQVSENRILAKQKVGVGKTAMLIDSVRMSKIIEPKNYRL